MENEGVLEEIERLIERGDVDSNRLAFGLAREVGISLDKIRAKFCNGCFLPLKPEEGKFNEGYHEVVCEKCGKMNRWRVD